MINKEEKPVKRIIIAGCRNYNEYNQAKEYIDLCLTNIKKENRIVIVSGGARGADTLGERYANENGYEIERYPADWKRFKKAAGPMRNKQMAEISDYAICFWDKKSSGTKSLIHYIQLYNKPIRIKVI